MQMSAFVTFASSYRLGTRSEWVRASFVRTPLATMNTDPLSLVGFISRPAQSSVGMMKLPASIGGEVRHSFGRRSMPSRVTSEEVG